MADFRTALYAFLSNQTLLTDVIRDRLYPEIAPSSAIAPYVVYNLRGATSTGAMQGTTGLTEATLSFEIFAQTSALRQSVSSVLSALLDGKIGGLKSNGVDLQSCFSDQENDDFVPPIDNSELGLFASRDTFKVWFKIL